MDNDIEKERIIWMRSIGIRDRITKMMTGMPMDEFKQTRLNDGCEKNGKLPVDEHHHKCYDGCRHEEKE